MTTKRKLPTLIETLEEVLPPEEAMIIDALITARFSVRAKKPSVRLPLYQRLPDSLNNKQ